MRDKKKAVFNILFLLLVFGLTVYGVFRGEDLESMMHSIRQAQWQWLGAGGGLGFFFIENPGSGSGIILYMVRINYYLVYDEIVWNPVEETVLFSVFFRWFFL